MTTTTTNAARLYTALDALAGGLPAFMADKRDDSFELEPYEPFNLTGGGEHVLFGFRVLINGDSCPDPQIVARIDQTAQTATIVFVGTLTGSFHAPAIPAGSDIYAIELLELMQSRSARPKMIRRIGGAP